MKKRLRKLVKAIPSLVAEEERLKCDVTRLYEQHRGAMESLKNQSAAIDRAFQALRDVVLHKAEE